MNNAPNRKFVIGQNGSSKLLTATTQLKALELKSTPEQNNASE